MLALCPFSASNFVIWLKFLATCQGYSHAEISIHQLNVHREVSPFSFNELEILLCVMHLYFWFGSHLLSVQKFLCVLENSDLPCYAEHVSMFNSVTYKRKITIILYWSELLNLEGNGNSAYKIKIKNAESILPVVEVLPEMLRSFAILPLLLFETDILFQNAVYCCDWLN